MDNLQTLCSDLVQTSNLKVPNFANKNSKIMDTIQISLAEYRFMQEELALLRDTELLAKMNRLIEVLFQEKYGLFMQDYTEDLTAHSVNNAWKKEDTNAWNNL